MANHPPDYLADPEIQEVLDEIDDLYKKLAEAREEKNYVVISFTLGQISGCIFSIHRRNYELEGAL